MLTNRGNRRDTFIGQVQRYNLVPFRNPCFVVLHNEMAQQGVLCGKINFMLGRQTYGHLNT